MQGFQIELAQLPTAPWPGIFVKIQIINLLFLVLISIIQ